MSVDLGRRFTARAIARKAGVSPTTASWFVAEGWLKVVALPDEVLEEIQADEPYFHSVSKYWIRCFLIETPEDFAERAASDLRWESFWRCRQAVFQLLAASIYDPLIDELKAERKVLNRDHERAEVLGEAEMCEALHWMAYDRVQRIQGFLAVQRTIMEATCKLVPRYSPRFSEEGELL